MRYAGSHPQLQLARQFAGSLADECELLFVVAVSTVQDSLLGHPARSLARLIARLTDLLDSAQASAQGNNAVRVTCATMSNEDEMRMAQTVRGMLVRNMRSGFAMHEMSIAESVLQIVEDAARAEGGRKVNAVWLEIGQLASVEKESLRFCFDVVTRDSIAQGARLEIIETAGQGWCMKCACNVPLTALYEPCPGCGGFQIQVTGGEEMRVKELEIE